MTDQNNSTNDVDDIDVTDASDVAGVAEVDATGETENVTKQDVPYRSGFVAVVGRPNVGKSTLINALIGKQIAIASSRPETTRKAIRGILTADHAQLVLVDTPGIHRPRTLLGQRLNDVVDESLADVDVVAFLLPADQEIGPGDKRILSRLRTDFATKREDGTFKWRIPLIAIVTKIDELGRQQLINKLIEINDFADFSDIVPVSALKHDNLAEVKNVLIEHTPEGPQMYPDDQISEERPEDTIAELVRGAFLETLDDELPHSLAVVVDSIDYPEDNETGQGYDGKAQVNVSIYVERDSQKPIIIGKGASNLTYVKKKLRTPVNRIVGQKAKLDLHVKVAKGWQSDPKQLETPRLLGRIDEKSSLVMRELLLYGLLPLGVHLGVEEGGVALDDLGANHLHGGGHQAVLLGELLGQDDELAHGLGAGDALVGLIDPLLHFGAHGGVPGGVLQGHVLVKPLGGQPRAQRLPRPASPARR